MKCRNRHASPLSACASEQPHLLGNLVQASHVFQVSRPLNDLSPSPKRAFSFPFTFLLLSSHHLHHDNTSQKVKSFVQPVCPSPLPANKLACLNPKARAFFCHARTAPLSAKLTWQCYPALFSPLRLLDPGRGNTTVNDSSAGAAPLHHLLLRLFIFCLGGILLLFIHARLRSGLGISTSS